MRTRFPSSTTASATLTLVLALASGCGFVKVTTGGSSSPDPAQASGESSSEGKDGQDAAPAAVPDAADPRQAKLYAETANITYKNVTAAQLNIVNLQSHYMMPKDQSYEPAPACGANPDPKWIKNWPSDSVMANPPVSAWIESRILKSYAPDLDSAYKKYREKWKAFDDDLETKRKAALEKKNFYDRLEALHALFDEGMKNVESLPAGKNVHPGVLHDLPATIQQVYKDENVAWALAATSNTWSNRAFRGGKFAQLRAWGDDPTERKQFAVYAMTGIVPELIPALPIAEYVHGPGGGSGTAVNTWLTWPEDVDLMKSSSFLLKGDPALDGKTTKASMGADYPMKTIEDMKTETKAAILAGAPAEEPKLVSVGGIVVALEATADGGAKVTLEERDEYSRDECTEYGPITGISSSGAVQRQFSKCRTVEQRDTHRHFVVTAKAWPSKVDLGDWVRLSGDLESVTTKGSVRSSTVDATVTARFVACFKKGEPLDKKKKDYNETLAHVYQSGGDCSGVDW